MIVIDYGKVIVWGTQNIPSLYTVSLAEKNESYYLLIENISGTSIENITNDERDLLQNALNLQCRKIDFDKISKDNNNTRPQYRIPVR